MDGKKNQAPAILYLFTFQKLILYGDIPSKSVEVSLKIEWSSIPSKVSYTGK